METPPLPAAEPPPSLPLAPPSNDFVRPAPPPRFPPLPTGVLHRFWFRFGMIYLLLYNGARILTLLPGMQWAATLEWKFWHDVVPQVSRDVLHRPQPITIFPGGSGDTTFNYIQIWCYLVLAFVAGWIWAAFDRARRADPWIGAFMRSAIRYVLAATLLSYGWSKILHQQMPAPNGIRLAQAIGDMSPMGLLWTFVGQSAAYSFFTGMVEVIPGVLLLFRRTANVGALLAALVMFNVAILNFCFDVPVKIYSTHLTLFAIYLATPALRNLWDVLILHRPTVPPAWRIPWPHPALKWTAFGVKLLVLGLVLYAIPVQRTQRWLRDRAAPKPQQEMVGTYEVQNAPRGALAFGYAPTPEGKRWRYVSIYTPTNLGVLLVDGSRQGFWLSIRGTELFLSSGPTGKPVGHLNWIRAANGEIDLDGEVLNKPVQYRLKRQEKKYLLMERGFNWVNETPFNR